MQVDHHSLFYLFIFIYLRFITPFHFTSFDFFSLSSGSMFDLGSASTHYTHLFDMVIHLSSLFVWGLLGLGLMTFSTRCISCMRGMGDYIIGVFEPSFLSFLSPYYLSLRYVPSLKTTLRPWLHTLCLMAHAWAILEISRRLFLGAWWMGSWDDDLHWGIPLLSMMDFHWWRFLSGCCLALRHSQFASSLGLRWIRSCGMTLYWGIAILERVFIGDTVTLLDTLHWDTLYSLMVDSWDDDLFWDTIAS